jgi:hypothetical protein
MPRCSQCKTETHLHARIPLCRACVDTPLLYFVVKIDGQFAVLEFTPKQIYARNRIEPAFVNCLDDLPFAKRAEAEDRRDSLNSLYRGSATRAGAAN